MKAFAPILLGLALLTAGCQQAPAPTPPAAADVDHAAEGRKALARQDWTGAASHFRLALDKLPGDLGVHYGLAIATSWLDQAEDATREFQWVVANAPQNSEEMRVAREWLAGRAGRGTGVAGRNEPDNSAVANTDERVGDSGVSGLVTWDQGSGTAPLKRYQIHLYGLKPDGTPKGMSFHVRTDFEGHYTFAKIPAGTYKLTDNNVVTPQWRLKVEIKPGETQSIDLSPQNSLRVRDDFPKAS